MKLPIKPTARKITDITIAGIDTVARGGRLDTYHRYKGYRGAKIADTLGSAKFRSIDANQLAETLIQYKFRGAEFGNWTSQNDRNEFVVSFIQSCKDLQGVTGFKQLGMEYTIGVAFGARGKSKALAHFEPHTFMINLTKEKGFGSFAHEYGHALDYFFGTYIEQSTQSRALSMGSTTRTQYTGGKSGTLRYLMNDLINNIIITATGNLSESYQRWKQYATSDYWLRRNEIFARFFEQYVFEKLYKGVEKRTNKFLTQTKYEGVFYLTPADFKRVLPLANKLMAEMKRRVNV